MQNREPCPKCGQLGFLLAGVCGWFVLRFLRFSGYEVLLRDGEQFPDRVVESGGFCVSGNTRWWCWFHAGTIIERFGGTRWYQE